MRPVCAKGKACISVVHDLQAPRLLFACEGRDHQSVLDFADELKAHGGQPEQIEHVCQDMSAAYAKGVGLALPHAQISYDRFHVIAMAHEAMDKERRAEIREQPQAVSQALGDEPKLVQSLGWAMRRNADGWSARQAHTMHWLQRSTLKMARAWRLKVALQAVYAAAAKANDAAKASAELKGWISWARRSRLQEFKKLAASLSGRFDAVVRGMLDNRSNAYVEAMNGLLQQAKRAARGFKTAANFIAIAYLRMSKLKHLPANPLQPAAPIGNRLVHRCV